MKTLLLTLLLLLSFDASAINVNKYLSGSWNNLNQSGHGFSIEVISDEQSILYWFVYHPDGTPTFIIAVGENKGNVIDADAYYNSGMRFGDFDPDDVNEIPWGKIKITFHSCGSATMEYDSDLSYGGVPYGSGTIPLTRLLSIDQMQCANNPNAGLYQGTFHSSDTDDDFIGLGIIAPNGEFALASFESMAGLGSVSVTGHLFSGGGTAVSAVDDEDFDEALTISGDINPEYRMVGSYHIKNGDDGSFDLYSIPSVYRRVLTLDEIAGDYDAGNLVSGATGSATISKLGKITGTEGNSCKYTGDISLPDPQFNILQVTLKVSSCGLLNGTFKGYGAQIDYYHIGDGRIIRLVTSNGTYARLMDIYR
jgi:hypothetical protein